MHTLYKQYQNSLNSIIKVSKANAYHQYFTTNRRNLLKVWVGITEIIHTKPKNKQSINSLRLNGTLFTEQKKIANSLNIFFRNIPEEIEKKLIPPNKDFSHYLKDPANNTFYMSPTNARDVEQKLKTLKTNKAVGANSIPTKILKTYSKSLSKPLSELINLSFAEGKFPTILKIAKVIPIHKKGGKSECDNYRPISLTSNISKLLEKLVHERLYSFLEKEKLLFEEQYGFRNKRSTTDALTDITDDMLVVKDTMPVEHS